MTIWPRILFIRTKLCKSFTYFPIIYKGELTFYISQGCFRMESFIESLINQKIHKK